MSLKFCNVCKSLLYQKDEVWYCKVCKIAFKDIKIDSSENLEKKQDIAIIDQKDSEVLPKTAHTCPRCANKEAYFWHLITTASDEADTIFHRCTKCGLTIQKGGQRGGR